jgi:predicted membrane protein
MDMADFANIVGNIGVVCFLLGFFLLQKEVLTHNSLQYLGLNLAGSLLLIYSLLFHWNLPAFVLEAAWAMISMYGIYKYHIRPKRS